MTWDDPALDDIDDAPSIDDLWQSVVELTARIDDLASRILTPPNGAGGGTPRFDDVSGWVEGWLSIHLEREGTGTTNWCAQWHQHPEAVSRLTGLWQSWEQLHPEWAGMSYWWRDTDIHLNHLLGAHGPFRHCRVGDNPRHRDPVPLPVEPVSDEDQDPGTTASPRPPPD